MAEYIEREAAIKAVCEGCNEQFGTEPCEPSECCLLYAAKAIPAADVAPVRHGRWEKRECGPGEYECKCSVCGYRDFMIPWHDTYWFNRNYCPNCGAKMDLEETE